MAPPITTATAKSTICANTNVSQPANQSRQNSLRRALIQLGQPKRNDSRRCSQQVLRLAFPFSRKSRKPTTVVPKHPAAARALCICSGSTLTNDGTPVQHGRPRAITVQLPTCEQTTAEFSIMRFQLLSGGTRLTITMALQNCTLEPALTKGFWYRPW